MVFNFNYPYPNSRYIIYSLIYIIEKFMLFTIIKNGYPHPYPYSKNKNGYGYDFTTVQSVSDPFAPYMQT